MWLYFLRYGKSSMKFNVQKIKCAGTIEKLKIVHPPTWPGLYHGRDYTMAMINQIIIIIFMETRLQDTIDTIIKYRWLG